MIPPGRRRCLMPGMQSRRNDKVVRTVTRTKAIRLDKAKTRATGDEIEGVGERAGVGPGLFSV